MHFVYFYTVIPNRMQRAVVGIGIRNGKYTLPKFSDCLLECFGKNKTSVRINLSSLENGVLVLNENSDGYELRHSPQCPIKLSPDFPSFQNDLKPHIEVAASVVVESSDAHVLLTKRSSHLRSSPNVWVMPGGHLEFGETVFEAGFRELKEETGLDIPHGKAAILGLWENVYPLLLGLGPSKSHVLIVYLHTHVNKTYKEITQEIKPNPDEVDSFCWLNASILSKLFNIYGIQLEGKQYKLENGEVVEKCLGYHSMFNQWLRVQKEPYSGVNYALRKWMKICELGTLSCKI